MNFMYRKLLVCVVNKLCFSFHRSSCSHVHLAKSLWSSLGECLWKFLLRLHDNSHSLSPLPLALVEYESRGTVALTFGLSKHMRNSDVCWSPDVFKNSLWSCQHLCLWMLKIVISQWCERIARYVYTHLQVNALVWQNFCEVRQKCDCKCCVKPS